MPSSGEVLDATWPAAALHRIGPWLVREGKGGGKRVSAATAAGSWVASDIALAEAEQERLGQPVLFRIHEGEGMLDAELARRGYEIIDPVQEWAVPTRRLVRDLPPLAVFSLWPPLAVMADIWMVDGIGPERLAIMDRVTGQKVAILARIEDRPAGAAFVAVHRGTAMLHALTVDPLLRRKGAAATILSAAAGWALDEGADQLSLVVTRANHPANSLYASLGMEIVGQYHYRQKPARERLRSS